MKVLIHSRAFLPSLGGLENVMHMIATETARAGHDVLVVTMTPAEEEFSANYRVLRRPSVWALASAALWADVCLVANITLRATPFFLILGRRVVTLHHSGYRSEGFDPRPMMKKLTTYFTENIFCSEALSRDVPGRGIVIPNSYESNIFFERSDIPRDQDILFVGRLVSDKGCHVLLDAMKILKDEGFQLNLTIVGIGPELVNLQNQTEKLDIGDRVIFTGRVEGEALAGIMRRHRILAVPSTWEPFGIVALEGVACGCAVLGTNVGGLPEAIGACGSVVRHADPKAFAEGLMRLLTDEATVRRFRAAARVHLAAHERHAVGRRYCAALEQSALGRHLA